MTRLALRSPRPSGVLVSLLLVPATPATIDIRTQLVQAAEGLAETGCVEDEATACLLGDRFAVRGFWDTGLERGIARVIDNDVTRPLMDGEGAGSALFWFFDEANVEVVVKVLDACVPELSFKRWAFLTGLTNVETWVFVVDTWTGRWNLYISPQGEAFLPIFDTGAFDCSEEADLAVAVR